MSQTIDPHARSKQPVSPFAGPYGHPFHPIFVTIPIGAWVSSLVFDVVAMTSSEPGLFARGAVWLIGIGIVGALLAAVFGFLDLAAIPSGTRAKRVALTHMAINLVVVVAFAIGFGVRMGAGYDDASVAGLLISLIALAGLGVSGWLGGKLAYGYGVRVASEATQAEGFRATN